MSVRIIKTKFQDNCRIIYYIKGVHTYIAKIFETVPYTKEEEKNSRIDEYTAREELGYPTPYDPETGSTEYIRNLQNIQEIEVYKRMKDVDIVECVYSNNYVKNNLFFFLIENKVISIDIKNWIKKFKLTGPFSIIITKKTNGYITLGKALDDKYISNVNQLQYYFLKIIKKVLFLNKKYNFVHGDLLTQNVLVHNNGNIKLFDFDLSTVGNTVSMGQTSYYDFNKIFPLSNKMGFLFDFSRLFLCTLFYTGTNFFNKSNKFLHDLVDLNNIYEDNHIHRINDAKIFVDWVQWNNGTNDLYENVIKFINSFDK